MVNHVKLFILVVMTFSNAIISNYFLIGYA